MVSWFRLLEHLPCDDFSPQFSEPAVTECLVLGPTVHFVGLAHQTPGASVLAAFAFVVHTFPFCVQSRSPKTARIADPPRQDDISIRVLAPPVQFLFLAPVGAVIEVPPVPMRCRSVAVVAETSIRKVVCERPLCLAIGVARYRMIWMIAVSSSRTTAAANRRNHVDLAVISVPQIRLAARL